LKLKNIQEIIEKHPKLDVLEEILAKSKQNTIALSGMAASGKAVFLAAAFKRLHSSHFVVCPDAEAAAYFYNDLENLFEEANASFDERRIFFFPHSKKNPYEQRDTDNADVLFRAEVINRLSSVSRKNIIVSYPEALSEKIISKKALKENLLQIQKGDMLSLDFVVETLVEYDFERSDFVVEPGQFAVRGGIVDVFSFSNDKPYRILFLGDEIDSIKSFNIEDQLTQKSLKTIQILPNIKEQKASEYLVDITDYLSDNAVFWVEDYHFCLEIINKELEKARKFYSEAADREQLRPPQEQFASAEEIAEKFHKKTLLLFNKTTKLAIQEELVFHQQSQINFNKSFEILKENFRQNTEEGIANYIFASSMKQIERLKHIFEDISLVEKSEPQQLFTAVNTALSMGFVDKDLQIAFYTDHQIFDRYHRFRLKERFGKKESLNIEEFHNLKPGDYVTHIDHGIGCFDGLEKIDVNGKEQEALRIIYKNNDLLYVSIHSLHRISKYTSEEGSIPTMNKLGTASWKKLKNKTQSKLKDIARELIALYAKRKTSKGFAFSPDNYLQAELEASFFFEDTEDQVKATVDVKKDMEESYPMDRLICGDVGFGKTEIAIRAAFKAVCDSKQVAVLVPTTILALQHYHSFKDRIGNLPCTVDYISRFKTAKEIRESLRKLKAGEIDILIGTHRIISKDIEFKDLGLLVIDEEQKFGVAAKEKLREIKVNVDTLTLTATPIPRTLQFSLMGARDLSVINTPPPNRYPIQTEIHSFNEDIIREAILYEVSREGQVFFVHNRVQNLMEVASMIKKFCPQVKIAIAHGQMDGKELENIMLDFIDGMFDVLVSTSIIESGLDISNANTIIINNAQNFGLSDLHQMRGRVGRTNKKAFCYLLAPPLSTLTDRAKKRLKALVDFSNLGSGFNIAMRDLDIRGAGNILGAEQSGFISEIGYEMYQKILDEALQELKEKEFKALFAEEDKKEDAGKPREYTKDSTLESDLQILIPDSYVMSSNERLKLYKKLNEVKSEKELQEFETALIDRFGELPSATEELLDSLRLRWIAKSLGIEKIFLKKKSLIAHFISDTDSVFWNSAEFTAILNFVQNHPKNSRLKEESNVLKLLIKEQDSVKTALQTLIRIREKT
jgi:transcription-repair coupling factor (superfamily II helicase)